MALCGNAGTGIKKYNSVILELIFGAKNIWRFSLCLFCDKSCHLSGQLTFFAALSGNPFFMYRSVAFCKLGSAPYVT